MIPSKYDNFIVHLELKTFIGTMAFGAQHYYGKLRLEGNSFYDGVEIKKTLTSSEAKRLNKSDPSFAHWKKGETSSRIETVEAVKEAAKAMWKESFPNAKILYCSWSYSAVEPKEILATTFRANVEKLNSIARKYHELDRKLPDNSEGWAVRDDINRKWELEFIKILEKNCG